MRVFIPRDTGFLSFLNWFMGSLCVTKEPLFPLLNYDIQKVINKDCKNFCYNARAVFNSWFLYFEPIRFKNEHIKHENLDPSSLMKTLLQKKITQGWDGSKEFMFFPIAEALRRKADPKVFQRWRNIMHVRFSSLIRPNKTILTTVDLLHKRICGEAGTDRFIAVHYRNPSHVKEQGEVRFEDYFSKIDELLEKCPTHHIYLATDTDLGVAVFKQRYGSILHYSDDVYRTSMDDFMEWVYNRSTKTTDREGFVGGKGYDSHAKASEKMDSKLCVKMGVDVLTDVLMIAKCDYFVHTISNFTITLSYVNPTIELVSVNERVDLNPVNERVDSNSVADSSSANERVDSNPVDSSEKNMDFGHVSFENITVKKDADNLFGTKCLYFNNTYNRPP